MLRQQGRMELDRAEARYAAKALRHEVQHISHNAKIDLEAPQGVDGLLSAVFGCREDRQSHGSRRGGKQVGLGVRRFRSDEGGSDLVAALEKRLEHRFTERLLTDNRDAHVRRTSRRWNGIQTGILPPMRWVIAAAARLTIGPNSPRRSSVMRTFGPEIEMAPTTSPCSL